LGRLGPILQKFIAKNSFATARILAEHFSLSHLTAKDVLSRELELRKFSRRWLSAKLSPTQKDARLQKARGHLSRLEYEQNDFFQGITTEDELWFQYLYQSDHMFARSRDHVIMRQSVKIGARKIM
jgi:hypothetical protein